MLPTRIYVALTQVVLANCLCIWLIADAASDPTERHQVATPRWHEAVVRIEVPITRSQSRFTKHFIEHCTATIISPGPRPILLSAWHCFDGYSSLGNPIIAFTVAGKKTALSLIQTGGSMSEDWALLTTQEAIPNAVWIPVSPDGGHQDMRLVAAGFTRADEPPGATTPTTGDRLLALHDGCRLIEAANIPQLSSCVARKGASGGPILSRTDSGSYRLYGIISAGDGESVSYFYPSHSLLGRISELSSSH